MKKIELSNLKTVVPKLFKNLSLLFFVVFLLILVLEGLVVKNSVMAVFGGVQDLAVPVHQDITNRIDFTAYDQDLQRLQGAQSFQATSTISRNPFTVQVNLVH